MTRSPSLYPPTPPDVPADLTVPNAEYRNRVVIVLLSLIVFAGFYLFLVVGSLVLFILCLVYPFERLWPPLGFFKFLVAGFCFILFLFLLKGFFKRRSA